MFTLKRKSPSMPSPAEALPGRPEAIPTASNHFVNGVPLKGPYPQGSDMALFGLGCFWPGARALRRGKDRPGPAVGQVLDVGAVRHSEPIHGKLLSPGGGVLESPHHGRLEETVDRCCDLHQDHPVAHLTWSQATSSCPMSRTVLPRPG